MHGHTLPLSYILHVSQPNIWINVWYNTWAPFVFGGGGGGGEGEYPDLEIELFAMQLLEDSDSHYSYGSSTWLLLNWESPIKATWWR